MIEIRAQVASTNGELLARLAAGEGVGEGCWLVADRQTAGRGRAGRSWFDGAGNFMGSTVARLRAGDPPPQTLALVAGIAALEAAASALGGGAPVSLKWPNDLLLAQAKLGGILLERQEQWVVIGTGVNLAVAPALTERATTCLAAHGCAIGRDEFAGRLAERWAVALARWHGGEWPALRQEWLRLAHPPGTLLSVRDPRDRPLVGAFAGIGPDGAAHLRLADGAVHVIHAGDVEMVGGHAAGD